jgi:transposase-like protein
MASAPRRDNDPLDVMLTYVRRYVAYPPKPRQLEEMMSERGISDDQSTAHRHVIRRGRHSRICAAAISSWIVSKSRT